MAVLLSPVGGAAAQFLDNNGNPLLAGKLFTYVAGTTTNQATYTSSAGVTPHTNPIILDGGGRVPGGEIWLTDGLQYKFVLKTANDVLIGTYDNLVGVNSNFVNFLTETEVKTATAGQTVFTLTTMQYQPGTNNLSVFVDGVNQIDGSSYSYVETDSTTVTFTAGLHVGALVKFTTAQTISGGATDSSLVVYDPPFANSVATTVEDKLAQTVSIKDFGAVGDGVTDDTTAIQDAVNTGLDVFFPSGTYLFTTEITVNSDNQALYGQGVLKPSGNINGVKITGGCFGVEIDLTFNSSLHSGGYCVYISNANRIKISKLNIVDGFGALYVEKANTVVVVWMWGQCRGPGIVWYGNDTTRSDVLTLLFALVGVPSNQYGLNWNGNCHSLEIKYLGIVGGKGAVIQNTDGVSTFPAIGRFDHIEVDYSSTHGIEIKAGLDYDFVATYVLGASGDGIRIASTINDFEVRITGGKFIGNTGYGINNLGGVLLYSGNSALYSNTLGETNGNVRTSSPAYYIDPNFYQTLSGVNPLQTYDTNDYQAYDRANNVLRTFINGAEVFNIGPNFSSAVKPIVFQALTVATLPASPVSGMKAFVTDAASTTFAASLTGGGANSVPVYYDGSVWRIG